MKKNILFSSLLMCAAITHAELQTLDNTQLQQVEGQASAATINWTLSLNQTSPGVFDIDTCADLRFCRFAIASNNRYDNGSYIDATGTIRKPDGSAGTAADLGKKQWLVFKGVQGTIQLQNVQIDGADLVYKDKNLTDQIKAALQITFSASDPIKIRNFGFDALSVQTDTVANEGAGNIPGYLVSTTAGTGTYAYNAETFDGKHPVIANMGRETGFTGLVMNGNLAMQGTMKIFSCDQNMSRCQ